MQPYTQTSHRWIDSNNQPVHGMAVSLSACLRVCVYCVPPLGGSSESPSASLNCFSSALYSASALSSNLSSSSRISVISMSSPSICFFFSNSSAICLRSVSLAWQYSTRESSRAKKSDIVRISLPACLVRFLGRARMCRLPFSSPTASCASASGFLEVFWKASDVMATEVTVCVSEGLCDWSQKSHISKMPSIRPKYNTPGREVLHTPVAK
mmetsp:Transcript_5709/g.13619  ORF Transcript_5709/g.13619 Transcript_5709/m.13619 type:complete len:211 (-) Transcript_5709:1910-2542(-)